MVEERTTVVALVNFISCVNSLPLPKYVKSRTMAFDIKMLSISFSTGRVYAAVAPSLLRKSN